MLSLPDAARLACWLNAWIAGRASADAALAGFGADGGAEISGPERGSRARPAALLVRLRTELRPTGVSAALPAPGDPLGLGGPAAFTIDAVDAGQAVILQGADLGLIPHLTSSVTTWVAAPAVPPSYLPDVAEAEALLSRAVSGAADALRDLDAASWAPDVVDAIRNLRRPAAIAGSPPFASPRAARVAHQALRAQQIVELAQLDDEQPRPADHQRMDALRPLERAVRVALVAATSVRDAATTGTVP